MAPPISMRVRTVSQGGGVACVCIGYTQQGSVTVLQVTGTLILQIILCYLIIVSVHLCLSFEGKQVHCENLSLGSLCRFVLYFGNRRVHCLNTLPAAR